MRAELTTRCEPFTDKKESVVKITIPGDPSGSISDGSARSEYLTLEEAKEFADYIYRLLGRYEKPVCPFCKGDDMLYQIEASQIGSRFQQFRLMCGNCNAMSTPFGWVQKIEWYKEE